ncbi:MAG: hypothetical protein JWL62_1110 [Hyphomicrobiales bacterium]|nr:hypothetical protein [Hyphomicrobiales bacterium]
MQEYTIRPFDFTQAASLVPLFKECFGRDVPSNYFQWKFLDNPAGPAIGHVAVTKEDETVGFYGMIPEYYRFGACEQMVHQGCDVMTLPAHRRQGLFGRQFRATCEMGRTLSNRFTFMGFGGQTTISTYRKMGVTVPFSIPFYFKLAFLCRLPKLRRLDAPQEINAPNRLVLDMIQENASRRKNTKIFDDYFIQWRLKNPLIKYRILHDDSAYAIFYVAGSFIFLFDAWEAAKGKGRRVMSFLDNELTRAGKKGILTFGQEGGSLARHVRRHGFI